MVRPPLRGKGFGKLNPFGAKAFRPSRAWHEESKKSSLVSLPHQANKNIQIPPKAQNVDENVMQINQDVDRINSGGHGFHTNFNPDSPVTLDRVPFPHQNWDSPQPCISPSSLINVIPDQEGFSAPLAYPMDFKSMESGSKESNGNGLNGREEKKQPFGMFDWNWDDDDDNTEGQAGS